MMTITDNFRGGCPHCGYGDASLMVSNVTCPYCWNIVVNVAPPRLPKPSIFIDPEQLPPYLTRWKDRRLNIPKDEVHYYHFTLRKILPRIAEHGLVPGRISGGTKEMSRGGLYMGGLDPDVQDHVYAFTHMTPRTFNGVLEDTHHTASSFALLRLRKGDHVWSPDPEDMSGISERTKSSIPPEHIEVHTSRGWVPVAGYRSNQLTKG